MSTELDLTKPGKLWADVEWEADTTFHVVIPQEQYKDAALAKHPQVDPGHQLMRPVTVPFQQRKNHGGKDRVFCDLDGTGRAGEIMAKLSELYERGHPRIEKVRALYIAKARDGNRIPEALAAKTLDLTLIAIPSISLRNTGDKDPLVQYLTVQRYKAGATNFKVELTVTGPIDKVEIKTEPATTARVEGGPSGTAFVAPVKEGQKYVIAIPASFKQRNEQKQEMAQRKYLHYGSDQTHDWNNPYRQDWMRRLGGTQFGMATFEREVWDGGNVTLRVAGCGNYSGIVKSVTLRAESWGASWLMKTPPPPFYHNVC